MARNKASLFFLLVGALLLQALHTTAYNPDKCENDALGLENLNPSPDKNPFQIKLDVKTYSAKNAIQVTVEATKGRTFKKIFLYAKGKTNQVGTFKNIPATLEGVKCKEANDAVKHKNLNAWKVTVDWVAQEDLGDIEFRATVVEDFVVFYEVKSEKVTYQEDSILIPIESDASSSSSSLKMFMKFTNLFVFLAYFYF